METSKMFLAKPQIKDEFKRMLSDFDAFCRTIGVKYCLIFGTLLGAYREKDIIDWDYDIDVCMTRDDYNLFLKKSGLLDNKYSFLTYHNDKYLSIPFGRFINKNLFYEMPNRKNPKKINNNLFIDVYVLDYYKDEKQVNGFLKATKFERFIMKYKFNYVGKTFFKRFIKALVRLALLPFSCPKAIRRFENKIHKFFGEKTDKFVTCQSGVKTYRSYLDASSVLNPILLPLGGSVFMCPNEPEKFLIRNYGDGFMTPTPPEKREEIKVYRKK